jgi:hypothetical protein
MMTEDAAAEVRSRRFLSAFVRLVDRLDQQISGQVYF